MITKKLSAVTRFFIAYSQPLDVDSFRRILAQTINSAKATNTTVHLNSVGLFRVLISWSDALDSDNLSWVAVPDILNLPMSGRSVGPDYCIALYSMLAFLTRAAVVSTALIQTTNSCKGDPQRGYIPCPTSPFHQKQLSQ